MGLRLRTSSRGKHELTDRETKEQGAVVKVSPVFLGASVGLNSNEGASALGHLLTLSLSPIDRQLRRAKPSKNLPPGKCVLAARNSHSLLRIVADELQIVSVSISYEGCVVVFVIVRS